MPLETEVIAGGSFPVRTRVKVPAGQYEVSLDAQITSPSVLSVSTCRATVASSGYNLPCVSATCPDCSNDATATDGVLASLLSMGLIRNAGLGVDDGDDEMEVDVWVGVPSSATPGVNTVEFTLKVGGSSEGQLSADISVISSIPTSQVSPSITTEIIV